MKTCNKCNIEKELTEFNKSKQNKDGYRNTCTKCRIEINKEWINKNKNKVKEYKEKWLYNNKEYRKNYYQNNKEIITIKNKKWVNKNKDKVKENKKNYYQNNKNKWKNIIRTKEQIELRNKTISIWTKNKKKTDPLFKLKCNIRTNIGGAIKRQGYTKKTKTFQLLGCTYEEFKEHLEKQFTKGMTWDNYGKWHLDHIYPVSLAKDEEELIRLNHYTNFQPLWAIDNHKKSNKIIDNTQLKLI